MKAVCSMLIMFFIGSMFVSLFHMSNMDMKAGMSDCPYMAHEQVICPMNLTDHIGAWKSAFLSTAPTLTLLIAAAGMAVLLASVAPNLLRRKLHVSQPLSRWLRARIYTFSYRPLQELFSSGILHPKLY